MPCRRRLLAAITLALSTSAAAVAAAPGAAFEWDLRLRQERVEDAGFAAAANATSARLRAGVRLVPATGWTVLVESEGIVGAGNHNDGANGKTTLPTVLDPGAESEEYLADAGDVAGPELLARLAELDDAEVREIAGRLGEVERGLSARRRLVFDRIDTLQGEIVRRYKSGAASPDSLLA